MALAYRAMTVSSRLVSIAFKTASHWARQLVLVDLPVDLVVVLEQQERASPMQRVENALAKGRCRR